jgi:hypothetical protein
MMTTGIPRRLQERLPPAPAVHPPPVAAWSARARRSFGVVAWELGAGWRELAAKLVAYYLVRVRVQSRAARGNADLVELVAATCRRDPRHAAFLLERLCYDFVRGRWRRAGEPRHLLHGAAAERLPERSLILLHAGLGMALTEVLLRPLRSDSPAAAFDAALDRFAGLVGANARPEFAPVTYESLGLMVRRFLPHLHDAVEGRLRARDPNLAACYWHGAGRAIYFLPGIFHPLPAAGRRGLVICRREAPAAAYRLDAVAGFCFAAVMIDLRHPELVARLLRYLGPGEVAAMASGVAGALMTRHHTCPEDPAVGAFLRPLTGPIATLRLPAAVSGAAAAPGAAVSGDDVVATQAAAAARVPAPSAPGAAGDRAGLLLAELWDREVRGPCAAALDRAYPLLRARGELATLGRYRPVGTLPGIGTPPGIGTLPGIGTPPGIATPPEVGTPPGAATSPGVAAPPGLHQERA